MPGRSWWSAWGASALLPLCMWLQSTLLFLFPGFRLRPQCPQRGILISCLVLAATDEPYW